MIPRVIFVGVSNKTRASRREQTISDVRLRTVKLRTDGQSKKLKDYRKIMIFDNLFQNFFTF